MKKTEETGAVIGVPMEGSHGTFFQTAAGDYFACKGCGEVYQFEAGDTIGTGCPVCDVHEEEEL